MTVVASPMAGEVVSLEEVPDPVFAERVMGDGIAVRPVAGEVVAPVGGRIEKLFEGGHAFVLETTDGVQVLVHVGIDTVHLKGDGFTVHASEGEEVEAAHHIVTVDLGRMAELNIDMTSPVVIISNHPIRHIADDKVAAGDVLFEVED